MVIAGVFAAEYALRRSSERGTDDTRTGIQTKSLAEGVRAAVKNLHGALAIPPDTGISINLGGKSLCFRHDIAVMPGPQFTPDNYNDDSWTCFTQIGTNVYRCEKAPAAGLCTNADLLIGTLVSDQYTNATILALGPTPITNLVTGECSFKMTLVSRQDPTAGAAVTAGNLTAGTDANPQTAVKIYEHAGF